MQPLRGEKAKIDMKIEEAVRRCRQILPMLLADVRTATLSHSVLEAFNDTIAKGMTGIHCGFNDTFNAVQNALALKVALDLARIFDVSTGGRFSVEEQDKASIPVLAALLSRPDVQKAFGREAERWLAGIQHIGTIGPAETELVAAASAELEERQRSKDRSDCLHAIEALMAISSQLSVEGSEEKAALIRIRDFRTQRLAHSLFDREPDQPPRFNDLALLLGVAIECAQHAALAIEGHNDDFEDRTARYRSNAIGYAECVLNGLLGAATKPENDELPT